jgi:RNA polymerase sigma-70 factor, ECF subfamily
MELETLSEAELARQSQAGSLEAFEQLVYRYEHRVYAFVFQFRRSRADASEVTQETFVRAFQAIAQFDPRHAFGPWLFTIARRKCIDHYRAAPAAAAELSVEPEDPDDPATLLARREEYDELWRVARNRLPDVQFQALWLRYVEEMDVAQVARVLRKSRTHVKVLLFRARQLLGRELEAASRDGNVDTIRPPRAEKAPPPEPTAAPAKARRKDTHEIMVCKVQDI